MALKFIRTYNLDNMKKLFLRPILSTNHQGLLYYRKSLKQDEQALATVEKALEFKEINNLNRAKKLFQHAVKLSPNNHDVLLPYVEFLEESKDFINANHFYLKAIMLRPNDSKALANIKRTLPVGNELDLDELRRIDSKRSEFENLNKEDPSFERLKKALDIIYIHHTVVIEGNTMSLDETKTVLENHKFLPWKSKKDHYEVFGLESALKYKNETLVNKNEPITVTDILDIHERVLGLVDRSNAGAFRKCQVYVGEHVPPPASAVPAFMDGFVTSLQFSTMREMHPIHIAAYAHQEFVWIHPFIDGNGRTARELLNLVLMRFGYPPVIITNEDKYYYWNCIQKADDGDVRPFYDFIAKVMERTIDTYLQYI